MKKSYFLITMPLVKKKTLILFFLFLAGLSFAKAQNTIDNSKPQSSVNIEGTYQIEVINTRSQPFIPGNLKQLVIENRNATKIIYLTLGTQVRLKILPLSEINRPGFKPLYPVAHITE